MKIGFVGLGAMGGRMCANIIRSGHDVLVYDICTASVDTAVSLGATAADSSAGAAKDREFVLTSLPNSAIVEATILGEAGVLEGIPAGAMIIDLSSITPRAIQAIARKTAERGVSTIDAPVSGGTAGAEQAALTVMVGASPQEFERARPVLACIGGRIEHVGGVGAGDTVKLVNNLLFGANMAALAEAMVLGVKAGMDPRTLYEVIRTSSGGSYALDKKYEAFFARGNFKPGFMVDLAYKDLQLAVDTAKDLGYPLVFGNLTQQLYEAARAKGYGGEDMSAVIKLFEEIGGVRVREE